MAGYHLRRHVPRLFQGMILDLLRDQVPAVCSQVLLESYPTPNLGCVAQTSPQYLATALELYRSCYGDRAGSVHTAILGVLKRNITVSWYRAVARLWDRTSTWRDLYDATENTMTRRKLSGLDCDTTRYAAVFPAVVQCAIAVAFESSYIRGFTNHAHAE